MDWIDDLCRSINRDSATPPADISIRNIVKEDSFVFGIETILGPIDFVPENDAAPVAFVRNCRRGCGVGVSSCGGDDQPW